MKCQNPFFSKKKKKKKKFKMSSENFTQIGGISYFFPRKCALTLHVSLR